jgi:hypothetical protein
VPKLALAPNRQPTPRNAFTELMHTRRIGVGMLLLAAVIAAGLGALHALEPGHGKTIVAAYLVGSKGTARHAFLLGLIVTIAHTAGVYLLGLVTIYAQSYVVPERLYPFLAVLSGMLIAGMGLYLALQRFVGSGYAPSHSHGAGGHSHAHGGFWHAHEHRGRALARGVNDRYFGRSPTQSFVEATPVAWHYGWNCAVSGGIGGAAECARIAASGLWLVLDCGIQLWFGGGAYRHGACRHLCRPNACEAAYRRPVDAALAAACVGSTDYGPGLCDCGTRAYHSGHIADSNLMPGLRRDTSMKCPSQGG